MDKEELLAMRYGKKKIIFKKEFLLLVALPVWLLILSMGLGTIAHIDIIPEQLTYGVIYVGFASWVLSIPSAIVYFIMMNKRSLKDWLTWIFVFGVLFVAGVFFIVMAIALASVLSLII